MAEVVCPYTKTSLIMANGLRTVLQNYNYKKKHLTFSFKRWRLCSHLTGCLLPTYIALHGAIFLLSPKYRAGRNRNKKQNEWFEKSGFIELSRHKKFRNFKILVDRVDSFWPVMFFYS